MNITIINRSSHLGGAAIACRRLGEALQEAGHSVRLLVVDRDAGDGDWVTTVGSRLGNRLRWGIERFDVWRHNGRRRDTLFALDAATHGVSLHDHEAVLKADVIILGWVNQATLSLDEIGRLCQLGKPVVWVMHDLWPMTAVCHHSYDCTGYHHQCNECPMLPTGSTWAAEVLQRKDAAYGSTLHGVAVSNWLADCARASRLWGNRLVTVIGNAIDAAAYDPMPIDDPTLDGKTVVAMGAARLDDPVKGIDLLADTTQRLATQHSDLAARLHLLLYGDLHDRSWLDRLAVAHTHVGRVDDPQSVLRRAHIVLSTSRRESFGLTLAEGMACGCTAVTTDTGGQTDIVCDGIDGFTARYDADDMSRAIVTAADHLFDRQAQHNSIAQRFDQSVIATQYDNLFNQLINENANRTVQ